MTDNNQIRRKSSVVVDISVAIFIIAGVMGTIWLYSGQPFPGSPPLVVIETGSMMHDDAPFGRIGTIDPGDIVIAKAIHSKDDVITCGGNFSGARFVGTDGYKRYGGYGDVIIYRPLGRKDQVPIIHRAMCWVEYDEKNKTYTVKEYGIYNATSVTIPELDLYNVKFNHSGFITKGDHNPLCDQHPMLGNEICPEPVKLEWVIGKAEGELPWFGSLKLLFEHMRNPIHHPLEVPQDSWICLSISIAILVIIPLSLDIRDYLREKRGIALPERWIDKIGKDSKIRKKVLKKVMIIYWIAFVPSLILLYLFSFMIIILVFIILANLYTASLILEDGRRWNTDKSKLWAVFACFTGPIALTLYYSKIKNQEV